MKPEKSGSKWKMTVFLILLVLIVVAGVGVWYVKYKQPADKAKADAAAQTASIVADSQQIGSPGNTDYVSFGSNYVFAVPKSYSVDDIALFGSQIVYPGAAPASGNLDELYTKGVVAIQPIKDLKLTAGQTFLNYVDTKIAAEMKKSLTPDVATEPKNRGATEGVRITAKKDGKVIRVIEVLNAKQPLIIAAQAADAAFDEIVAGAFDVANSATNADDTAIAATVSAAGVMLNKGAYQEFYNAASQSLQKSLTLSQIAQNFLDAKNVINNKFTAPGGLFDKTNNTFSGRVLFVPEAKDKPAYYGVISLGKDNGQWKVTSLQLPKETNATVPPAATDQKR